MPNITQMACLRYHLRREPQARPDPPPGYVRAWGPGMTPHLSADPPRLLRLGEPPGRLRDCVRGGGGRVIGESGHAAFAVRVAMTRVPSVRQGPIGRPSERAVCMACPRGVSAPLPPPPPVLVHLSPEQESPSRKSRGLLAMRAAPCGARGEVARAGSHPPRCTIHGRPLVGGRSRLACPLHAAAGGGGSPACAAPHSVGAGPGAGRTASARKKLRLERAWSLE